MTPVAELLLSIMESGDNGAGLPTLLARHACRRLPASAAGIVLMNAGAMGLAVGSDDRATELENLQLTLGEGPCVDAFVSGRLVLHPDLHDRGSDHWPVYTPAALELGARAVFSCPLLIGGIKLGVLDIYRDTPGQLDDATLKTALLYADAAVLVVLHLQSSAARETDGEINGEIDGERGLAATPLEIAFDANPEVHQATGMVSVQADVTLTEALLLLRTRAFSDGRDVNDVARDVVSRKISFK